MPNPKGSSVAELPDRLQFLRLLVMSRSTAVADLSASGANDTSPAESELVPCKEPAPAAFTFNAYRSIVTIHHADDKARISILYQNNLAPPFKWLRIVVEQSGNARCVSKPNARFARCCWDGQSFVQQMDFWSQ